jgi:hypothetical protein
MAEEVKEPRSMFRPLRSGRPPCLPSNRPRQPAGKFASLPRIRAGQGRPPPPAIPNSTVARDESERAS